MLVTNPLDVGYLSGFLGGDSYLLSGPRSTVIISDFRYAEELEHLKPFADIYMRKGPIAQAVGEVFGSHNVKNCAAQADHLTLAEFESLRSLVKKTAGAKLMPTSGLISRMRAIKHDSEVLLIEAAIKIQQKALLATLPTIRPGQTESQVAARLEMEMKSRGSSEPSFQSIVAARANGSLPHYRPSDKARVARNQPLLIDWGATYRGYRGDMTRTFTIGRWPAKIREIYAIVLEAHLAAVAVLKAGRTNAQVDRAARDVITKAGYGPQFGHGLGHGIGLNVHEEPRVAQTPVPAELVAGMVVTIEPGIYLPGVGGVRIEDDYLVTASGSRNLCSLPKSLEWSTL